MPTASCVFLVSYTVVYFEFSVSHKILHHSVKDVFIIRLEYYANEWASEKKNNWSPFSFNFFIWLLLPYVWHWYSYRKKHVFRWFYFRRISFTFSFSVLCKKLNFNFCKNFLLWRRIISKFDTFASRKSKIFLDNFDEPQLNRICYLKEISKGIMIQIAIRKTITSVESIFICEIKKKIHFDVILWSFSCIRFHSVSSRI